MELLDIHHLYQQLLFGETTQESASNQEAAVLFQSPQPPMLGAEIDNRAPVINHPEYAMGDGSALQMPGGGIWAGDDGKFMPGGGIWEGDGGLAPGETWAAEEDTLMLGDGMSLGNDQLMHGGGIPDLDGGMQELLNGVDLSECFDGDSAAANSLWTNQTAPVNWFAANQTAADSGPTPPADDVSQPGSNSSGLTQVTADSPGLTSPMGAYPPAVDYPLPPAASAEVPQAVPDNETTEVAQMVRVAAECGDKVSTVWSEEENRLLLEGLSRFADQDNVTKCFNIASGLAKKTTLDVAYQIRRLLDLEKNKAAKQAELEKKESAGRKVTKGNGTKGASKKSNKHPLSEEALNSKSTKDLKRDNARLMDRIEEILKTGKLGDVPDYFYHVKLNMDALQQKVSDLDSIMEGLSIGDEEWEDVLKDRNSSAGKDTTTPP